MNAAAQNFLTASVFEVPNPPTEFGQDGGKFFRCYDALAQEIDDDMTSGLKEQLDGMLIFAGLFAGVNTAFLALTIPLLSADPADDTNALLAQNNAILMQLILGRNDTVPADSPLPSTAFSPSHDILTINALFALSLAFAIISSFLAVLGRQWLVYYRKRGGGGPDRQRWEQLKRFLGAERWRLEAILDDVLPSLLQIGLIIFCISLILYLRHLSPAVSIIVGIPLSVGLAFFIGSALCTIWDRFCPFHSPLSHLLLWTSHPLSWIGMAMKRNLPFTPTFLEGASLKREEESLESLQAIALQRAICISDDPATVLHATANIFAIASPVAMNQLVDEPSFQQRFSEFLLSSHNGMLQLQGYNVVPKDFAESVGHLYRSVAAHIALTLDSDWVHWSHPFGHLIDVPATAISVPVSLVQRSSSNLIKSSLGIFPLRSSAHWHDISERDFENFGNHLTACSQVLAGCSDRQFLAFFSWIVSWFPKRERVSLWSLENIRGAYRGNNVGAAELVREAFGTLLKAESRSLLDCDTLLTNMLRCVERIVADEQVNSVVSIGRNLQLFESCEVVLRNPRLPDAVGEIGRKLRMDLAQIWSREYTARLALYFPGNELIKALDTYLIHLRNFDRTEFGYFEDVAIVQVFGSMLRQVLSDNDPERTIELAPVCETLNAFVSEVYEASRQIQKNARRARDPDERWCHWQEEPLSIKPAQTRSGIPLLLLSNPAAEQNESIS